jgi:hypothetical protein
MMRRISFALLAIAALAIFGTPAFALVEGEGYKIGGDFRLREEMFDNILDYNDAVDDENNFLRGRLRLFGEVAPTDQFKFYIRLTGEPRYYFEPDVADEFNRDEFVMDNLYVEFKGGADSQFTTCLGRQDIMQGSLLLVLDGTPLDGSRTIYTDAIREKIKLEDLDIDIFLSMVQREDPLPIINEQDMFLIEQDTQLHGVYLSSKAVEGYTIDGYYYYLDADEEGAFSERQVHTIGGRVLGKINEELSYSGEVAYQIGDMGDRDIEPGTAVEAVLTYKPANMEYKPEFKLSALYLPGDDPSTYDSEQWDPLNGRWPRFSELYIYSYAPETRIAWVDNLQMYTASCGLVPMEDAATGKKLSLFGSINYMLANENPRENTRIFGEGDSRGWLYVAKALYSFNKAWSCHAWLEFVNPGDYYADANEDSGYFARWEVMYKF